ncbi:hypothetical protein [Thermostichus vulcanus]|uniref:Uncharacterized protein n=1 Tax=Thermostichus vulcanus str. 'Rupite' TaxID=2813851 RepID=A0ABT0C6A4_THEVL|nr:hypothetical protein [Thermostichus vulcanus]MCJ2541320.1 hypothetical protein [Thermostichus vulcanus str. 'Rupite']
MSGSDPSSSGGGNRATPSGFGQVRQAWALWLYPLLWLLTFVGIRSSEPQIFGIPAWYLGAGLIILLLVPLNLYVVQMCWPRMRDD